MYRGERQMAFMDRVNVAPLTRELMKQLLTEIDGMPDEQRQDFTGRGLGLLRFLQAEYPDQGTADRAAILVAFDFRMQALTRLRRRPEYKAWSLQQADGPGGSDVINEALIDAAAEEPLIERGKKPAFNPTSFFKRVLEASEAEGHS